MIGFLAALLMSGGFGLTAFADEGVGTTSAEQGASPTLVTIEDELVPIADVPQTADTLPLWLGTSLVTGLVFAALGFRKREN